MCSLDFVQSGKRLVPRENFKLQCQSNSAILKMTVLMNIFIFVVKKCNL